jgi:PBSX family phage terminase large subunit
MKTKKNNKRIFSEKQIKTLTFWRNKGKTYDAIICDGAIRSGKTYSMSLSFILWAFSQFNKSSFGICGKTVTSLKRNLITPLIKNLIDLGFSCNLQKSANLLTVTLGKRENYFYLFGGRDESSSSLIQGITLSGILLDEVALMPRSFVEQALARCSVEGSKFYFNCNPENPNHWFYNEWIKKVKEKNALYLHFTMDDNPSLSKKIKNRYKSLYSGNFYERFIEGKWVSVEGLVYPMFNSSMLANVPDVDFEKYYISCDYGTVNPTSFGLRGKYGDKYYRIDEYYYSSKNMGAQLTDDEYYDRLCDFIADRPIDKIIIDPSAASFITLIKKRGKYNVLPAKNDVLDGIRKVCSALKSGKIIICKTCKDAIREFSLYRWEEGCVRDCPKKENDHSMDEIRYFVTSVVEKEEDDSFFAFSAVRRQ